MKRGKRFLKNNNIYVYMGTVIFFVLAIVLGIIMYMLSKTTTKINNEASQIAQQQQNQQDVLPEEELQNVSTEIGKNVDEQTNLNEKDTSEKFNTTNNTSTVQSTNSQTTTKSNKTTEDAKSDTNNQNTTNLENSTNEVDKNSSNDKVQETKKEIVFAKPAEGEIICEFAKDNLIYSETLKEWITHMAIDIKADKTSVIKASADGIVRSIVNDPRYGLTVVIEHDDGYQTVYSNLLTAEFVVEGEEVKQGQTIGTVGNTASFESEMESHLHFELLKDGEYLDPAIYIK